MEVVEAKERLFEAQARIDGLNLRGVVWRVCWRLRGAFLILCVARAQLSGGTCSLLGWAWCCCWCCYPSWTGFARNGSGLVRSALTTCSCLAWQTDVVFGKASYAFGVAVCAVLAYAIPYLFRT